MSFLFPLYQFSTINFLLSTALENEIVGWHHQLNGYEFEQALGDGEEQGSLACVGSQRVGHYWVTEQQQMYIPIFTQFYVFSSLLLDLLLDPWIIWK